MSWDVLDRCSRAGSLTASEQAVAEFYASALPGAAFMNQRQVAAAARVSTASVTRLARKLGFGDFRELAASLSADARQVLERPGDRLERPLEGAAEPLGDRFRRASGDLAATREALADERFAQAVELLCDTERPLLLAAVASGRPLLDHTGLLLSYLRAGVRVLGGTDRWPHELAGLDARAVVLATAYDRDPLPLLRLLHHAGGTGAATIVITNVATSPLLALADVPLRIVTSEGTPFGSRVALLAALEALTDGVAARLQPDRGRADAIERVFAALDIHPGTGRE